MFIEVILARTGSELSEVRYGEEQWQWFRGHAAALEFAAAFAASLERSKGEKAFVSVCRPDGTWAPLKDVGPFITGD